MNGTRKNRNMELMRQPASVSLTWQTHTTKLRLHMLAEPDAAMSAVERHDARTQRTRRIISAWLTSAPSKVFTLLVQVIAVPVVYRSLGPAQYTAYASVTAIVWVFNFLNLGMGGAVVTPLAQAVALRDRPREAELLGTTFMPLVAI